MTLVNRIVSGLLQVDRKTLHQSQIKYSATDRILYNIDQMSVTFHHKKSEVIVHDYFTMGFFTLTDTNINAIKLSKCSSRICFISGLKNASLNDFLNLQDMETAVILSDTLVNQIQNSKNSTTLIVTVFFHNALFNEEDRELSTSMIFGIVLKGKQQSNF